KTPIHHIPVLPEYRETYSDIAHIFHAMLPLFEQLKLIKMYNKNERKFRLISFNICKKKSKLNASSLLLNYVYI
ncbi:unnamed protein product, partial [Rotaria sp. Silwood2]